MDCPFCNITNTKVIDSRLTPTSNKVRRRRECEACEKRFTTYEAIEESFPLIIKGDGRREVFALSKVKNGINRAIEKRPVTAEQVDDIVGDIENKLRSTAEKEIPASIVGEYIMDSLKKVDQVAYVRFASVYRSFEDISAFQKEIDRLQKSFKKN